jgi:hypothetical protein
MQKKDSSKAVKVCHPHLDQYGNQLSGAVGVRKYASCTSLLPLTHRPSPLGQFPSGSCGLQKAVKLSLRGLTLITVHINCHEKATSIKNVQFNIQSIS